jgi:hypothetical protein
MWDCYLKEQPYLRVKRACDRIPPKTITLGMLIENPVVESLPEIQNINNDSIWKIRPLHHKCNS